MAYVGIDVHKHQSQICLFTATGEVLHQRIQTQRERFAAVLAERPKACILIEASTESAWVARCLEALGHEVIVADPNDAPMYAQRSRRVKTDRRDAEALAHASRPAHRTSDDQRHVRGVLTVREALVRSRTRWISVGRAAAPTGLSPAQWGHGVRDLVMELCCALHNFRVRLSPWLPMI